MSRRRRVSPERLREVLSYDPETGIFRWLRLPKRGGAHGLMVGDIAGTVDHHGYREIGIDGHSYRASQLAWLYVHGRWADVIDHRDHNTDHNGIKNLRETNKSGNVRNMLTHRDTRSGIKGACLRPDGKYEAFITIGYKQKYLGRFPTAEEANAAYLSEARKLFGEYACDGLTAGSDSSEDASY